MSSRILQSSFTKPIKLRFPILLRLPSFSAEPLMSKKGGADRDVKWVEGVRSIAAILVISCHLWTSYNPNILRPQDDQNTPPTFWQRPFLRIIAAGRPSVAMFFLLTGFTNALKPIRLSRGGDNDAALRSLTRSIPRRFMQLIVPAAIATVISWVLCQAGAFNMALRVNNGWIRGTTPRPADTIPQAVIALFRNLVSTWTRESNYFDPVQWCLMHLVGSSMWVYLTMIGTVRATPGVRMLVVFGLFVYSWLGNDCIVGMNTFPGILFAELYLDKPQIIFARSSRPLRNLASIFFLISGLYFASFPESMPEFTAWSTELFNLGQFLFPRGADISRFWSSIGCMFMFLGVFLSQGARDFLSRPIFAFIGRLSYPMYLIHAPLIRTMLVWCVFGSATQPVDAAGLPDKNALIQNPGLAVWLFWTPVYFAIVIYFAFLWTLYVDPCVAWAMRLVEETLFPVDNSVDEKRLYLV